MPDDGSEPADEFDDGVDGERRERDDLDATGLEFSDRRDLALRTVDVGEDTARRDLESPAVVGQGEAPTGPVEQGCAEPPFEGADGLRERWL